MPRIALFSELHANLEALQAVREALRKESDIREVYCLGDFVGYGPSPNEVVEIIREMDKEGYQLRCNIGNHDAAAIGRCQFVNLSDPEEEKRVLLEGGFNTKLDVLKAYRDQKTRKYIPVKADAQKAIAWTIQQLKPESADFLKTRLAERLEIRPGVISVHASPRDTIFEYVRDAATAQKCFESPTMNNVKVCFHGHTHVPVTWYLKAEERLSYGGSIIVMDEPKQTYADRVTVSNAHLYLINVGAVGQPRGEDRRPTYVIYDPDAGEVTFHRVNYDSAKTRAKILAAGLPDSLAGRLAMDDTDVG